MRYNIKRECWNEKTFNGYTDNPYWRIDFRGLSFGLKDNGRIWAIGEQRVITQIDIADIRTIIEECNLNININIQDYE